MNQRIDPPVASTTSPSRWRSRVAMLSVASIFLNMYS